MRLPATAAAIAIAFAAGWLVAQGAPPREGDLGAAVSEALREGDRLERAARLAVLLEQLDPDNLADTLAVYRRELTSLSEGELRLFFSAWARFDGRAAFEEALGWKEKQTEGVEAAARSWAFRDPEQARHAIEAAAAEKPRLAQGLRQNMLIGWVYSGGSELDAYLQKKVGNEQLLTLAIIAKLRSQGGEALLAWSEEFGASLDPRLRAKVFRKVVRVVARRDPERAARFVLSRWGQAHAVDGPRVLAEAWLEAEPREAFAWLRDEAPAESRAGAVELAFGRWLHRDREAARAWLDAAERTSFHDPAIEVLARQTAARSLDEALDRCGQLLGAERREPCEKAVARASERAAKRSAGRGR